MDFILTNQYRRKKFMEGRSKELQNGPVAKNLPLASGSAPSERRML
jgi:hypothetical protein